MNIIMVSLNIYRNYKRWSMFNTCDNATIANRSIMRNQTIYLLELYLLEFCTRWRRRQNFCWNFKRVISAPLQLQYFSLISSKCTANDFCFRGARTVNRCCLYNTLGLFSQCIIAFAELQRSIETYYRNHAKLMLEMCGCVVTLCALGRELTSSL